MTIPKNRFSRTTSTTESSASNSPPDATHQEGVPQESFIKPVTLLPKKEENPLVESCLNIHDTELAQAGLVQEYEMLQREHAEVEERNMRYRFELEQVLLAISAVDQQAQQQFQTSNIAELENFVQSNLLREQEKIARMKQTLQEERECQEQVEQGLKNIGK